MHRYEWIFHSSVSTNTRHCREEFKRKTKCGRFQDCDAHVDQIWKVPPQSVSTKLLTLVVLQDWSGQCGCSKWRLESRGTVQIILASLQNSFKNGCKFNMQRFRFQSSGEKAVIIQRDDDLVAAGEESILSLATVGCADSGDCKHSSCLCRFLPSWVSVLENVCYGSWLWVHL